MPDQLRRYLIDNRATAGDWLLIRVVDGEVGLYEVGFESRLKRDGSVMANRNKALADAVYQILRKSRYPGTPAWDLVFLLLARGHYQADVAPDPLDDVLRADHRFVEMGLDSWMLSDDMTPEAQALAERRRMFDEKLGLHGPEPERTIEISPSIAGFRAGMERAFADARKAISEHEFSSIDDINAFLQDEVAAGGLPRSRPSTPLEEAQDLIYDAWESPSGRERIRMARKALQISPDCADAYVLLAEEGAKGLEEALVLYSKGVAAGERALGSEYFENAVGEFWGIIETRPYMRARAGLAQTLWAIGRLQEAIGHLWDLLRLNPGDNQGLRYILLSWLLEKGDDVQVERLLKTKEYRDDPSAIWAYGRSLHAFRKEGDSKAARRLLAEAIKWNPHVPAYLLGRRRLPEYLPDTMGFGDESEAEVCAAEEMAAWRNTRGALVWLKERV